MTIITQYKEFVKNINYNFIISCYNRRELLWNPYPMGNNKNGEVRKDKKMRSDNWVVRIWKLIYPLLLYFVITQIVVSVAAFVIGFVFGLSDKISSSDIVYEVSNAINYNIALMTFLAALATIPFCIWFYRKDTKRICVPKLRLGVKHWILIIVFGASACLALNNLISFSGLIEMFSEEYEEMSNALYSESIVVQVLTMVIAAPVLEELIFRGLIFKRLRTYTRFIPAAMISAAIFGIYHGYVVQGIYAFCLGFLMCLVYERTHTIIGPMVFHAAANAISVLFTSSETLGVFLSTVFGMITVTFISIVLMILCILLINGPMKPKEGEHSETVVNRNTVL